VPLSDAARADLAEDPGTFATALTGGDDYEIHCTVSPDKVDRFRVAAMAAKVAVTEIGVIGEGEGARFHDAQGKPVAFERGSFSHF
jgi:thiamine-monophosphate kinase